MARNNYGPLREAHQQALDALNSHVDAQQPAQEVASPDREPTRPEGRYQQSPGWTSAGGMEQQQASANAWQKASQERSEARDALNQHIDRGEAGERPEQSPDVTRTPENDIER